MLNATYFVTAPDSLSFDGSLEVGGSFFVEGSITFDLGSQNTIVDLNDDSSATVSRWTIGLRDVTAFFGANGYQADSASAQVLSFSDVDFGLALHKTVDDNDDRSWLTMEGSADGVEILGIPEVSIGANDFNFYFNLGLGEESDGSGTKTVIDYPPTTFDQ